MDAAVYLMGLVRASILDVRWHSCSNPHLYGNLIAGVWTEGARDPCETPWGGLRFGWAVHSNVSNGNVRALCIWLHSYLSYRTKGVAGRGGVFCFRFILPFVAGVFSLKHDEVNFLWVGWSDFSFNLCLVLSFSLHISMSSPPSRITDRFPIVQFRFINNWGNEESTCIYRLRVHGEE